MMVGCTIQRANRRHGRHRTGNASDQLPARTAHASRLSIDRNFVMRDFRARYGEWGLVTGATSGIGEEFARQLAARGLNLVLVARSSDALGTVGQQLTQDYQIRVRSIAVDLREASACHVLAEKTADLEVGLLVSNAGAALGGAFLRSDVQEQEKLLHLNVACPMKLAHHFGGRMVERSRGGIIFVASCGAYQALPYLAGYGAAKSFILNFGEALHVELKPRGIDVVVVSPGPTDTPLIDRTQGIDLRQISSGLMPARAVVKSALRALGRRPSVIPGGFNKVLTFVGSRMVSRRLIAFLVGRTVVKGVPERLR